MTFWQFLVYFFAAIGTVCFVAYLMGMWDARHRHDFKNLFVVESSKAHTIERVLSYRATCLMRCDCGKTKLQRMNLPVGDYPRDRADVFGVLASCTRPSKEAQAFLETLGKSHQISGFGTEVALDEHQGRKAAFSSVAP